MLHCINDRTATDPACGNGNFLTETFLCLRRLENRVIRELIDLDKQQEKGQMMMDIVNPIKVSISQFYGIEINDFAVSEPGELKMMISLESYYDMYLKGKSIEEIKKEIKELENEIKELKEEIKNPNKLIERFTPETALSCNKEYLRIAKKALRAEEQRSY